MKQTINDTSPDIEKMQIEGLRKLSGLERLQIANSLTKTAWELSWRGFCERYSDLSLEKRKEKYVELLYGIKVSFESKS